MEPTTSILKKMKKLNRKGKLIHGAHKDLDEKKELVNALMRKCNKTEDEVLKAYEEFHLKHENGFISNEEYINSSSVSVV